MHVSLKDLIETGCFGPVRLGMSRAQVESFFGVPDDMGGTSRQYPKPSIWRYGDVELHFVAGADSLFLIHLDDFDVPTGGKLESFDPWIIRGSLTLSKAEEQLSQSGISYQIEDYELDEDAKCMRAGVGVKLIFMGHDLSLRAVSYANPPSA
jgi:hypothetical protein